MDVRVVIADDHTIFREGLLAILTAEGFDVVSDVGTTEEALEAVESLTPDLAIYDVHMPYAPAAVLIARTRSKAPSVKIAMLSMHADRALVDELIRAGAHGYFNKTLYRRDLCDGLRALLQGAEAVTMVPSTSASGAGAVSRLTDEEVALLTGLVGGCTNRELAARLYCSEATIKRALHRLYARIDAGSRMEAVTIATRLGIGPSEAPES